MQRGWNGYTSLSGGDIQVSIWISEKTAGIYVRGGWGEQKGAAHALLGARGDALVALLGAGPYEPDPKGHLFGERYAKSYLDEATWNDIIDWMEARRTAYVAAITDALEMTQ